MTHAPPVPLLEVRGLSKSYGAVEAVRGVSFTVAAGEKVALIGPNGAGKSTCFGMIGGQARPDGGSILLGGREVTGMGARRMFACGVGRTFQVAAIFASMSVRQNIEVALISRHRDLFRLFARRHDAEAARLLARVGLADQAERAGAELSYGDVKRLEFAMALANRPRLLLMDEPTAGMAAGERAAVMDLVSAAAREDGIGVLFTEHDLDAVFAHADRILVLDRGALIADGPPARVRADPRVRAVYLGEDAP